VTTEAIDLHNSNIEIFAVGIGSDISITEFKAIASRVIVTVTGAGIQ
jgi:hypothetical protein